MAALPGVTRAQLNFAAAKLIVEGTAAPEQIAQVGRRHDISAATDNEPAGIPDSSWQRNKLAYVTGLSGAALLTGWLLSLAGASGPMVFSAFLAATVLGGAFTVRKAFFSLGRLYFDMNVLMTAAVIGAFLIGEWSEGASVAFLYSVSNMLEAYTMDKARRSIRDLMEIAPKEALVRRACGDVFLPVDQIRVNDTLIVKPGEKIAMDGIIINGRSAVNQAAITGESIPVEKAPGDEVFAGTLNCEGAMEVRVTKLVNDTTMAKIVHMVEDAQAQKAPAQRFIDKFAAVYTPVVIALACGIILVPPLFMGEPWLPWIYRGLTLLVVSCPCALVISTPVALVSAIGNAARHGVLIKGGLYLEQAGSLSAVAFDKTGTLTVGKPVVQRIFPLNGLTEHQVLAVAAGIEQLSSHPLAAALLNEAKKTGLNLEDVTEFTSITGKGASGKLKGSTYYVGSPKLFTELGFDLKDMADNINNLENKGQTVMLLGTDLDILGIIAVADQVRTTAAQAVQALKETGIRHTVMLTGDNHPTARAIAGQIGIDQYLAELLPGQKVDAIREVTDKYGSTAMVGDGINDAPALAAATVGIAMGAAGTDTALETADIALMSDDLNKIPFVLKLSRATLNVIRQNIAFAILIKLLAILLIFPGWLTLWMAILADMGASVLVTLNGIRLVQVGNGE